MGFMAALHINTVTENMLLNVFFLSGALACDLFITTPQKMEALNGSCLQIPCNFSAEDEEDFNNMRDIFGVWIKNDPRFGLYPNNVIFNGSKTDNTFPAKIIGNLRQKNCTTVFSSLITETYFFRIENRPFLATSVCNPLQIKVKDSPPSPRISISGELREAEPVTITCSAFTPCPDSPPILTWNLSLDAENRIEENADRTIRATSQVNIILSDEHDGLNITCSAAYPVGGGTQIKTAEETVTLNVSYSPKNTLAYASPAGLVSLGSSVNLTCSSRAKPPVSRFTWFKSSKDGPLNVSDGDFYSFTAISVSDLGVYYCMATNDRGNQTSSKIHLAIEEQLGIAASFEIILGVIVGVTLLVCLIVFVWWLRSTRPAPLQTQNQKGEEPVNEAEEEIHYGEINFSQLVSTDVGGRQEDTEYAEVKVAQPANTPTQTHVVEDIYAQVKKH